MTFKTPYYLIDEKRLRSNLQIAEYIKKHSGAKMLLALKCFSTPAVFPLMRKYLDGTTSSSLYEARLGFEEFGKETHSYCVGYTDSDIASIGKYADTVIFNSLSQLKRYYSKVAGKQIGLRINPGVSHSHYVLADPNCHYSRLGVTGDYHGLKMILPFISGVMFHFNCDNNDFHDLSSNLDVISKEYSFVLNKVRWVSLGGGILFAEKKYPYQAFAKKMKKFSDRHGVQVYLEPGDTLLRGACDLVTSVVDIVYNREHIAIVDSSIEAHMLDLLTYRLPAVMDSSGKYEYIIAGRSCLAGDSFGKCLFRKPLKIGDVLTIHDAGGYSIVKRNWFNGLQMPTIVIKRLNGSTEVIRQLNYKHFKNNHS